MLCNGNVRRLIVLAAFAVLTGCNGNRSAIDHDQETRLLCFTETGRVLLCQFDEVLEDRLSDFAGCAGPNPLYSWRLTLTGVAFSSLKAISTDGSSGWRDPRYEGNDAHFRDIFQLTNAAPARKQADIFAITGPDTAFEHLIANGGRISELPEDAVLLIDASLPHASWMEPIEIEVTQWVDHLPDPSTNDGRYVLFVDGEAWLIRADVPDEVIRPFLTVDLARDADREETLSSYLIAKLLKGTVHEIEPSRMVRSVTP